MKDHIEYYPEDLDVNSYNIKKLNRQVKLKPTTGKFWCGGCDGVLVGECERCWYCGTRNTKNRHNRLKRN